MTSPDGKELVETGTEPLAIKKPSRVLSKEKASAGRTGPRTLRGKKKSRYNAIKYGIFTNAVLRGRESRAEYLALVNELCESLQPVGRFEEILVEKLAFLVLRYRRLLQAESAEFARAVHTIDDPNVEGNVMMAQMKVGNLGMIAKAFVTQNELALETAVHLLKKLRDEIQKSGLDWGRDAETLETLYGRKTQAKPADILERLADLSYEGNQESQPDPAGRLAEKYRTLAGSPESEGRNTNFSNRAAEEILCFIEEEIQRLESVLERWRISLEERRELEKDAALVPRSDVLDRLQRYEAGLERSIERTLTQLERLQRMRLGQPLPPPIKVNLSA